MFKTVEEYIAFQRKEGRALGRRLREVIALEWTEEKDVWQVMPSCSVEDAIAGLEAYRVQLMKKLRRDSSTTWTEFINGSAYTTQDVLDEIK